MFTSPPQRHGHRSGSMLLASCNGTQWLSASASLAATSDGKKACPFLRCLHSKGKGRNNQSGQSGSKIVSPLG